MTDLAALVVRMQADNSQYVKALDQATARLSKFSKDTNSMISDLAAGLAGAFSIDKLVEFSSEVIENAASLERLSQEAGVSVEALSSLKLAAAASGVSQDELGTSFKKLNVAISEAAGNATSKAGQAFRALGISVTDANGKLKTAAEVLPEIADAFQGIADGPNKTAIAVALLGRAGQQMIPVLDQGSKGLDDFRKQAEAAGIVLSGPLAEAAEDFEKKFAVLKATISSGFGNELAAQLLPVLSEIEEQLASTNDTGEAFKEVAGVIVGGVKLIAAGVIEVVSEFTQLGQSIGALGAVAVAVAKGQFSEASAIWQASTADNVATEKKAMDRITAIFEAGTDQQLNIITTGEAEKKRIKSQGTSLEGLGQSDDADKKLKEFSAGIEDQAKAFGLGGAALVRYKLQFGPLADALAKASQAGKDAAASAIKYAEALQFKEDSKTTDKITQDIQKQIDTLNSGEFAAKQYELSTGDIGKAYDRMGAKGDAARASALNLEKQLLVAKDEQPLQSINDQLDVLNGKLVQAAKNSFDLQNKSLNQNLAATGDTAGQAKVQQLRDATVAQAAFNEQTEKANQIQLQLSSTEATLALQQSNGQITDLQYEAQISTARAQAVDQLNQVYAAEKKISDDSGLPKLMDQTQQFQNSIKALAAQEDALTKQVRGNLEDAFSNNFEGLITGAKSFSDAFKGMVKDIENSLAQLVSKNIAQQLFGAAGPAGGSAGFLAGLLGGGSGGGGLSSLLGGGKSATSTGAADAERLDPDDLAGLVDGFATGGTLGANKVGIVGENGPEIAYSGARPMNIVPNAGGAAGVNVTNHFTVQSNNGTISRQSQNQIAAAAARSLGQASRRNAG